MVANTRYINIKYARFNYGLTMECNYIHMYRCPCSCAKIAVQILITPYILTVTMRHPLCFCRYMCSEIPKALSCSRFKETLCSLEFPEKWHI